MRFSIAIVPQYLGRYLRSATMRTISSPLDNGAYRKLCSGPPRCPEAIVATSDFSGLTSLACALESAAARLAMDWLDLCMAPLHAEEIKAHRARFGPFSTKAMAARLL